MSVSALTRLDDIELWDNGDSPCRGGLSDAESLILLKQKSLSAGARIKKEVQAQLSRAQKGKKRRSKAQPQAQENVSLACSKATKNHDRSSKNDKHGLQEISVQSNVVPFSQRLEEVCRAVSDAGQHSTTDRAPLSSHEHGQTDVRTATRTPAVNLDRISSRAERREGISNRGKRTSASDEDQAHNNNTGDAQSHITVERSLQEAKSAGKALDNMSKETDSLAGIADVSSKATRDSFATLSSPPQQEKESANTSKRNPTARDRKTAEAAVKPSKLPKPGEDRAPHNAHSKRHSDASESTKLMQATPGQQNASPRQEASRTRSKDVRKPPRPVRTSRSPASRIPVPCKNPTNAHDCHVHIDEGKLKHTTLLQLHVLVF